VALGRDLEGAAPLIGAAGTRMAHPRFPVAVHVFLLQGERVLLLRRCNTGYEDGKLSVPAGHVEPGESVTRAALRETAEEVGLSLNPERLSVVGVMHRRSDEERVDFFLAARLDEDAAPGNREPEKCSELVWAELARLPADVIPYVRAGIDDFRRGRWFREFGWDPDDSSRRTS
jgi:8-oxo-dGTP diphosphatase